MFLKLGMKSRMVKRMAENVVYIGRGSIYGNKFKVGRDGSRLEVVLKYKNWFINEVKVNEKFYLECLGLVGKEMYCPGCKGDGGVCHGEVIRMWISGGCKRSDSNV